ncbi:MAG: tRNA 4-thiouridine(8) synthase ThiI [Clostridia bacterium]|nr:tRNA 4-thiouridine(8) synthase ThiI [Clostridia bacterium]
MDELFLVKYGEIILKGLNRPVFESKLVQNIRQQLKGLGVFDIHRCQAAIYIEPTEEVDMDAVEDRLKKTFGIVSISRVKKAEKTMDAIFEAAVVQMDKVMREGLSFKVETKRSDKNFPMKSPEISREIGGRIADHYPELIVDVHNPDVELTVEVRETYAYVYTDKIAGAGGMPVGCNGKVSLMLSGGIDSPVAGYMMAKRGLALSAIHFYSYPYTSERAREKVLDLAGILAGYCGHIDVYIVPFTEIQLQIRDHCPEEYSTLIMRRIMMRIAEKVARSHGADALITGESLGQVASQTLLALGVTNEAVSLPVFRPLIGMDKEEIITISRKIGTFETSILPYEDCCTVFTPKHPATKPKLDKVVLSESKIEDLDRLIEEAVAGVERVGVNG